jgi:uncharacterized membrane protein
MAMPTEEELKTALAEAGRMREQGEDSLYVAKSLLNLNYQNERLKEVLKMADKFLRTGMSVTDHQKLKKAIDNARKAIERTGSIEGDKFWL